jgi:hypothetical protein
LFKKKPKTMTVKKHTEVVDPTLGYDEDYDEPEESSKYLPPPSRTTKQIVEEEPGEGEARVVADEILPDGTHRIILITTRPLTVGDTFEI